MRFVRVLPYVRQTDGGMEAVENDQRVGDVSHDTPGQDAVELEGNRV